MLLESVVVVGSKWHIQYEEIWRNKNEKKNVLYKREDMLN